MVGSFPFQGGGYDSFPFNGSLFVADNSLTSKANCRPCRPPFWLRCAARWPWLRPRRCWWRSRGDACGGFPQGWTWRVTFLAKICGEKVPMPPPSWWKNKNVSLMRTKLIKKNPASRHIETLVKKFHRRRHRSCWTWRNFTVSCTLLLGLMEQKSQTRSRICVKNFFGKECNLWQSPIARMVAESTDFHIWKQKVIQ